MRLFGREYDVLNESITQYGDRIISVDVTKKYKHIGGGRKAALDAVDQIGVAFNTLSLVVDISKVVTVAVDGALWGCKKVLEYKYVPPGNYVMYSVAVLKEQPDHTDGRSDAPFIAQSTVVNLRRFYVRLPERNDGDPLAIYVTEYEYSISD